MANYRKLGRKSDVRNAMLRSQATALLAKGKIITTEARAKELRKYVEPLIALAVRCARIFFGVFPFMALQVTGQNTFVALNYPKHALFFSLLRKIVLVAPLTLLLPGLGLGVNGVFWAEFISQLVGSTACFTTMYFVIWRKMRNEAIGSRQ